MDARTGEVFPPELMEEYTARVKREAIAETLDPEGSNDELRRVLRGMNVEMAAEREAALERAREAAARNELVAVSEQVAQTMALGRREQERRRRRRRATKQARRRNR